MQEEEEEGAENQRSTLEARLDEPPKEVDADAAPPVGETTLRRTGAEHRKTTTSSTEGAPKKQKQKGLVPKLGIGDAAAVGAAEAGDVDMVEGEEEEGVAARAKTKTPKGRVVPGSLLLTSVSASDLPDTEKGVFSKQVCVSVCVVPTLNRSFYPNENSAPCVCADFSS